MKTDLYGLLRERLAVDPPLRFDQGLDDVSGFTADRDRHRVVFGLDVQSELLESLHDLNASVETLHALHDAY